MMKVMDNPERQRILLQALRATTLTEIETAEQELRAWVRQYPEDVGIVDAFEQLDLMRRAVEEISKTSPHPVAAK